jgi:segregation and condensation protein B
MSDIEVLPELKQIIGALLFGAKTPLSAAEIRRVLQQVAEPWGGKTKDFAGATETNIRDALNELKTDLAEKRVGLHVSEVANGFRLENDVACGPWLRHLLARGRPSRLSRPALETLAIIAYRQPCMRSEIESVRGVAVDQIIRNLLEMQLIRIVGRSELPGRPWQFGTTQRFLEHFGLRNLEDLPGIEELRRMEDEKIRRDEAAKKAAAEGGGGEGTDAESAAAQEEVFAAEEEPVAGGVDAENAGDTLPGESAREDAYEDDEEEYDDEDEEDDEEDDDEEDDEEERDG